MSLQIREVIVDLNHLMVEIQLTHRFRLKHPLSISYNIYSDTVDNQSSTDMLNRDFIQSLTLINNLLRLESNNDLDRQEFLSACKKEYKYKKFQLNLIEEFRDTYTSERSIWWYTREAFFAPMLDKILRSNIEYFEQFLSSRLFIQDIHQQLTKYQYPSTIRVYFGQLMWLQEIDYLQNSRSKYLAINTFWLTNTNEEKTVHSLKNLKREKYELMVMFSIDADPTIAHRKPFADIGKCCHFDGEGEILFTIGSVFRLVKVESIDQIYFVRLELCEDNAEFYQSLQIHNENVYGNDKIDLRIFGEVLYRMEQYDLAERIYQQLLNRLSSNDPICSDLYFAMGMVAKGKREYDASMKYYEKALKYKARMNPVDFLCVGKIHACIGEIHRWKGNDGEALKCFEKAVDIYIKEHAEYHQHMADFYDNIASIHRRAKQYDEALVYSKKALSVDEKQSSGNSIGVAKSHNNIATVYCLLQQHDLALYHYQHSLAIKLHTSPIAPLSIANSYGNIASVYKAKGDLDKALNYYRKAVAKYQEVLPIHHPDVKQVNHEIQLIVQKMN